jgi:PAS domain S-box-containing protein
MANGVPLTSTDSDRADAKTEMGMDDAVDWTSPLGFRDPKNELEAAVQRYVDLYDFAPIAYVSLDRFGRVEESNPAAISLLDRTRKQLVGAPFILRVVKSDSELFLRHLLRCRSSKIRVETELCLKNQHGDAIPVQLSSTPSTSSRKNGVLLYQTAIIDLRERKVAEKSLAEAARQREALYDFVQRRHEAKSFADIHEAALDAVLSAVRCDRASILLLDGKGVMRFVDWRGLSDNYRRAVEGHSPWKPDAKHPEPIWITDVDVADIPDALKSTIRSEGIGAAAFIPLVAEGKLIGKFTTYYDAPHVFTDQELSLSLTIAGQLALGLERKRAEEALRISEERLRAIVEQAVVGIARCDLKGKIIFINDAFCKMLGYHPSELIGKKIPELTHPNDLSRNMRLFANLVATAKPFEIEKRYIRKDGSILWASVSVSPMRDAAGKTDSAVAVAIDISDSRRSRAALEEAKDLLETRVRERTGELVAANEELQNEIALRKRLEGEILSVSDREQRRLGQDLHDSLCQHLTAIAFMARAISERMRLGKRAEPKELDKICDLINAGVTEARTIARGLHPVEMDPAGLHTALHSLLSRQSQLPYRLDMDEEPPISDPTVALHLYRIAREAVINANKHASAREIIVRMRSSTKRIALSVTDDGIGMSPNSSDGTGMGLQIMDYRARSIGGRLEIKAVRPHGTRVTCYLPRR